MATKKSLAEEAGIEVGSRVRLLVGTSDGSIQTGTVRVVNHQGEDPGHQIGVELDEPVRYGHSLELVLPREIVDPDSGVTVGRGWWTHPEYVELID